MADGDSWLFSNLQDGIVEHLRSDLGPKGLQVERSETDDEFVLGSWIDDNMSQVAEHPHAFVWTGTLETIRSDSTRRQIKSSLTVRVFVMTRNTGHKNEEAQKKLADKWSLAVAASLSGARFGDNILTNEGLVQNLRIETLGNGEDAAMWEVRFDLDLDIDFELVLSNL